MSEQQNTQQPVAWVRFCSDGCYEGPIMDSDARMDSARRNSGAWTPLYAHHPDPVNQQTLAALEALVAIADNGCADAWRGEWDDARAAIAAAEAAQSGHIGDTDKMVNAVSVAIDRATIRQIFMAHGFTIKDGQTDLKPYVYEAAEALMSAQQPAGAQPVAVPDELSCNDIERLRMALSWEGYSTPEGLEQCAARWPELVRDLIAAVLDRKARAIEKSKQPSEYVVRGRPIREWLLEGYHLCNYQPGRISLHNPRPYGGHFCYIEGEIADKLGAIYDKWNYGVYQRRAAAQKPEGV